MSVQIKDKAIEVLFLAGGLLFAWRPTCASCGSKLVERTARYRVNSFWSCPAYPRCRFTLPMRST